MHGAWLLSIIHRPINGQLCTASTSSLEETVGVVFGCSDGANVDSEVTIPYNILVCSR